MKDQELIKKFASEFACNIPDVRAEATKAQALLEAIDGMDCYREHWETDGLEWISHGDIEKCKESFINDFAFLSMSSGVFADTLAKHYEYCAVMQVALYSKAAIAGGLSARTVWALREYYLRKISHESTIPAYFKISYDVLLTLTTLVHNSKTVSSDNPYVNKAKSIIQGLLGSPISVDDIAEKLGISADYLSKLFKQHTGKTLKKYVTEKKMQLAGDLLQYTDYALAEIYQLVGFSSYSYFCKAFKDVYNSSPKEYRQSCK